MNLPASIFGKRKREFFATESDALLRKGEFDARLSLTGTRGIAKSMTVAKAIELFTQKHVMAPQNANLCRFYLDKFTATYGKLPVDSITPEHLEAFWERPNWGNTTRAQAFRYLRMFLNFSERYDWIERNPARRVEPPKPDKAKKGVLSPGAMLSLLREAKACGGHPSAIAGAFLCLGGLAGLRTEEAFNFDPADWDGNVLHVLDGKTGPRYVRPFAGFAMLYNGTDLRGHCRRTFYKHLELICRNAGVTFHKNCLRHSFASYHLALHEDAPKTAFQLGHSSPVMVYRAYARAVRKEQAEAWNVLHLLDPHATL